MKIIDSKDFPNQCDWCPEVKGFCAYIIMCHDGTMYKGSTGNLKLRVQQHFNGNGSKYTKCHKPYSLLHFEVFATRKEACSREFFFKREYKWIKENMASFKEIVNPPPDFDNM